ncbi:MAG: DNA translocase FtsK 4TM domain-containing protein [Christensenellales bacterium]
MNNDSAEKQSRSNRIFNGLMISSLALLLFCILVGVFGRAGAYVRDFFVGVFGYAVYGYTLATLVSGLFLIFGKKPSANLGAKICYILIVAVVIMMCHISLTKHLAVAGYSTYIGACFESANTPAGWLGALVAYPLCKAYVFAMIILSLFLAGLVAMAIVINVNSELIFPSRVGKVRVISKPSRQTAEPTDIVTPKRELSNISPSGKPLSNVIPRSILGKSEPLDYEPLEKVDFSTEESGDTIEENGTIINPQDVQNNIDAERQAVLDYWYNDGEIPRITKYYGTMVVDPSTRYGMPTNTKPNEEVQDDNEPQNIEQQQTQQPQQSETIDERYKPYLSEYRKQQLRKNIGLDAADEQSGNEQDSNQLDFMQEIENALNQGLQEYDNTTKDDTQANQRVDFDNGAIVDDVAEQPQIDEPKPYQQPEQPQQSTLDEERKARAERLRELKERQAQRQKEAEQKAQNPSNTQQVEETPVNFPYKSLKPDFSSLSNPQPEQNQPKEEPKPKRRVIKPYNPPSLDCLRDYQEAVDVDSDYLEKKGEILTKKLADFGVKINVINIVKGPTFSRIEFETNAQLGRITSKYNDMIMWLGVESMRLEAPIPGKTCCGIEIPNEKRGTVGLKAIVNSPEFNNTKKEGLFFALGKDIDGKCYVGDISKFPHALIAGSSGAGKSVCINGLICSLLYKYSPEQLRMILVDPKIVELSVYHDIPHLLIPEILSEPKKVVNALNWALEEMERRYRLLQGQSVADIEQYNEEVSDEEKLPYLLIIVDEVGDIMMTCGDKFESAVFRLAGKARAAGIHIILATQRPSVDVITGTIKANLTTRIAFAVTSGVDSKTILDCQGAEKLLRMGDMLYKESTRPSPVRLQGAFIHTKEVKAIVEQVRGRNEAYFDENAANFINKVEEEATVADTGSNDKRNSEFPDELCMDVLDYGLENSTISISGLQRRFSLGFNRAGRIVDWLKSKKYVRLEGKNLVFALNEEQVEQLKKRALEGDE